jgi:hypothetical protein
MKKKLLLFAFSIPILVKAQVASELSPQSLTLPRLSTAQQNSLPPQQAGNMVYNADEKKLAVHDGTEWNYISGISNSSSNPYKNHKLFTGTATFTVPPGITNILIEIWGNGGNGQVMSTVGANVPCSGGGGGQYVQCLAIVNPSDVLEIVFSDNYNYLNKNNTTIAGAYNASASLAGSGLFYNSTNYQLIVSGENGKSADFSFQQANAGVFRKIVKGGAGGGTYPTFRNGGNSYTMEFDVNSGQYIGGSGLSVFISDGKFPGGGGGCGHNGLTYGVGAVGAIFLHY